MEPNQAYVTEKEIARKLGLVPETLQAWRRTAKGPPFVKLGRAIRYRLKDVEAWLAAQTVGAVS